jgi:hypothetical protein
METANMKRSLTTAFVAALLSIGSAAIVAAPAADPVIGTWKLNVAKSKFSPGPGPKSETRTYAESAQGIALSWKSVGADGKEGSVHTTYKVDGSDYPVTGNPDFDSVSLKRVDSNNVEFTLKKGGKVAATGSRSVSKDGKVLTNSTKGTSAKGEAFDNTLVFDRQ